MRRSIPLVLAGLWIGVVAAQEGTDFSGRWVLESSVPAAVDVPRALTVRQSVARTNVRGEPMKPFFKDISVERHFDSGARTDTHQIGVIGGTVAGSAGSSPEPTAHFAVTWDGDALVFAYRSRSSPGPTGGVWTERREVWSLDATGRLRVVVTTQDPVSGRQNSAFVYRRQAS